MTYRAKPKKMAQKSKNNVIILLVLVLLFLVVLVPIQHYKWLNSFNAVPDWGSDAEQIEIEFRS